MSNKGPSNKFSSSPKEDYDPLEDGEDPYLQSFTSNREHELDDVDDEQDSPANSLNADREVAEMFRYGVTPPSHPRAMKRAKEKSRSNKQKMSQRELLDIARQSTSEAKSKSPNRQQRSSLSPGRPEHLNLLEADEENDPKGDKKMHRTNSKSRMKGIGQDRDFKHRSSDLTLSDSMPKEPIKVDSPNRFRSLDSIPVPPQATSFFSLPGNIRTVPLLPAPETEAPVSCPKDRKDFLKTFAMLMRLGNRASKERENRGTYNRQLSSEQEYYQNKLMDLIWMELRAYLAGRTMSQQDAYFFKAREVVPSILEEVMTFKVCMKPRDCGTPGWTSGVDAVIPEEAEHSLDYIPLDMQLEDEGELRTKGFGDENTAVLAGKQGTSPGESSSEEAPLRLVIPESRPLCITPSLAQSLPDAIADQKDALLQVTALLNKLERIEWLYSHSKAIGEEHQLYSTEAFQQRLDTLCLWMNITRDIGHKLQQMALILQVENLIGVDWPWLDYESPNQVLQNIRNCVDTITPNICLTSPSDEDSSEEDEEEKKEKSTDCDLR